MKINLLLLAVGFISFTQANADFKGSITAVRDGGSVIVNSQGRDILVKLNSVVTPYPNQNLYSQSRIVAENVLLGRNVNVITSNNPSSGCVYGELIGGGVNLNEALLMTGFAWVYNKNTAPDRYKFIQEQNEKNAKGIFNPDSHFQFESISLTPSYFFSDCLATSDNVPISEQQAFVEERDKFGFVYSIKILILGVILGLFLLYGLFYYDNLGLSLNLSEKFKIKKKNDNDGFR